VKKETLREKLDAREMERNVAFEMTQQPLAFICAAPTTTTKTTSNNSKRPQQEGDEL
jgi:hypothetical protein